MAISLKPIGDYDYDPNSCSFDEAWEHLEDAYRNKKFVICRAVAFSETEGSLDIEYHNIRGRIKQGHITHNRNIASDFFVSKTFCVQITNIYRTTRSFTASRLPVEIQARAQLRELKIGTPLEGILIKTNFYDDYCFVDVMEGITFYLGEANITWKPRGCQRISDHFSPGDRVSGFATYIEPLDSDRETSGRMSCINLKEKWGPETAHLTTGTIVQGIAHPVGRIQGRYYIAVSPLVYIEFETKETLSDDTPVQIRITEKNDKKYRIIGELDSISVSPKTTLPPTPEPVAGPVLNVNPEPQSKSEYIPMEYTSPVKTTVSPFAIRDGEQKEFESVPNQIASHKLLQERVRSGQINEFHFRILEVVNTFVFCTSKMIAGYMSAKGVWPKGLSRDKLNKRLESMAKLGILDRLRFSSEQGQGIYRVYFLGKNGEALLQVHRGIRKTSYNPVMLATPVAEVKRYLSTNQIILAYMQSFPFFDNFVIRKVYNADEDTPVRVPARIMFENSNLLLETQRRYAGWEAALLEKSERYFSLLKKHQARTLPVRSQFLQEKSLYLLLVCEDETHAWEIRNLLYGHPLYPYIFFTYDLLIFQRSINHSIFNYDAGDSPIYYDVTELLHYNIKKSVDNDVQKNSDDVFESLLQHLKSNPQSALRYLREHHSEHLDEYVKSELSDLFRPDIEKNYVPIYPEDELYYVWLLHLISHNLLDTPTAAFYEPSSPGNSEYQPVFQEPVSSARIEPKMLEQAVHLVVHRLENYISNSIKGSITKRSTIQTSGTQFGYDVGMDFHIAGNNYRLSFECKSYQTLKEKNEAGGDVRLRVGEYGKNLLQYYMYCEKDSNEHNYWILVSPYADLQNDFYKNLVERWNAYIPFMKLAAITRHQTEINCEAFFSLVPEAFQMVYQRACPELSEHEKEDLAEKIYNYIVGVKTVPNDVTIALDDYPFPTMDIIPHEQRLNLKSVDGRDIQQTILQSLDNNQDVFLIGEYGSGKTYMTRHLVETILNNSEQYAYCPVWFQLVEQEIGRESEFALKANAFIQDGIAKHDQKIRNQLRRGTKQPLVILDGLDEIASGLGSSSMKRKLLLEIMRAAKRIIGPNVLFLISSREIDFNSCMNNRESIQELSTFRKIQIGECQLEDAVKKLRAVEDENKCATETSYSLTDKNELMQISRKPLYYGFLRELIRERGSYRVLESEIDLLHEIIVRSINHYLAEPTQINSGIRHSDVLQWLCDAAIRISRHRTNGEPEVYEANRRLTMKGYLKNVVRITAVRGNEYHVTFYHNAIREYLVAYCLSERAKEYLRRGYDPDNLLSYTLQDLALTPEMIGFFCTLIRDEKDAISVVLQAMLQAARTPEYSLMGTNLISILCRLDTTDPGLHNLDLSGIYADNLHLYHCTLENLNLQGAHLRHLHLFDVKLNHLDLRDADLEGLVLGLDGGVADVHHRVQGKKLSIFGLYENNQLIEYRFEDLEEQKYEIIAHSPLQDKYPHICVTREDVALYSDRKVAFIGCPNQSYSIPQDCRLLRMTPTAVVMEKRNTCELIYHQRSLGEAIPKRLSPNQTQMLCCLDRDTYLYHKDHTIYLCQNGETFGIINITTTFECFTAICDSASQTICVYIKYSEGIQKVQYHLKTRMSEYYSMVLPKSIYQNMVMINQRWMYAVSDQTIFLLDLEQEELQPISLQARVGSMDLTLEDANGIRRVQGDREYQMLKNTDNANQRPSLAFS